VNRGQIRAERGKKLELRALNPSSSSQHYTENQHWRYPRTTKVLSHLPVSQFEFISVKRNNDFIFNGMKNPLKKSLVRDEVLQIGP